MLVMGLAPIAAPLLGGQVLRFTDWRGVFAVLGAITSLILVGCLTLARETHPEPLRHTGGLGETFRRLGGLIADPVFRGHMLIGGLHSATLFTYISMSSFALRGEYGLSPQAMANNTALALTPYGRSAGSASALLGTSQFLCGAVVAPLVSIIGSEARVMGATMAVCSLLNLVVLWSVTRAARTRRAREEQARGEVS